MDKAVDGPVGVLLVQVLSWLVKPVVRCLRRAPEDENPKIMSDAESFDLNEARKKSKDRRSVGLRKRLSMIFGQAQYEPYENGEEETNSRVFTVEPAFQENNNREKFHSVGTEGLEYTTLEVHRLSATSTGTKTSLDHNVTPSPSVGTGASIQTNSDTRRQRRKLKPRPQSYADSMSEARRGSFGASDFAKRSSFGLGEVPLLD